MSTETSGKEQEDNLSDKFPQDDHDKPESEASGKTSCSDSGIEDGKITPTSEEEAKSSEPELHLPPKTKERSSETTEVSSVKAEKPEKKPDREGTSWSLLNRSESQEPRNHVSAVSKSSSSVGEDVESLVLNLSGDMSVNKGSLLVRVCLGLHLCVTTVQQTHLFSCLVLVRYFMAVSCVSVTGLAIPESTVLSSVIK